MFIRSLCHNKISIIKNEILNNKNSHNLEIFVDDYLNPKMKIKTFKKPTKKYLINNYVAITSFKSKSFKNYKSFKNKIKDKNCLENTFYLTIFSASIFSIIFNVFIK